MAFHSLGCVWLQQCRFVAQCHHLIGPIGARVGVGAGESKAGALGSAP